MRRVLIFIVAYKAENTIENVLSRIPESFEKELDIEILIIDDSSDDDTFKISSRIKGEPSYQYRIALLYNPENLGYGGNQKSCYNKALDLGADIVIMLHPDYQYTPKLIQAMASIIANN